MVLIKRNRNLSEISRPAMVSTCPPNSRLPKISGLAIPERKRKVAIKCLELEEMLERQGWADEGNQLWDMNSCPRHSQSEIESKVASFRALLLRQITSCNQSVNNNSKSSPGRPEPDSTTPVQETTTKPKERRWAMQQSRQTPIIMSSSFPLLLSLRRLTQSGATHQCQPPLSELQPAWLAAASPKNVEKTRQRFLTKPNHPPSLDLHKGKQSITTLKVGFETCDQPASKVTSLPKQTWLSNVFQM